MIFDSNISAPTNWDAVQESPYTLGLEGGLMHVYENECNYNAIMKAAGLSELKYYKENGGDLFVQEAGAAGSLIDRFIAFFKKVIEKIKQIFKKFVMVISSYVSKDKDFAKKYKPMVFKNFKEFKFTGWDFDSGKRPDINKIPIGKGSADSIAKNHSTAVMTDEDIEEKVNTVRGNVVGESVSDDKEFRDALHKCLYGDDKKEMTITAAKCAQAFEIISDTKKNIKGAETEQKSITDKIETYIKQLEKAKDSLVKGLGSEKKEKDTDVHSNRINAINKDIELNKEYSNIATTTFSAVIGGLKDLNRQSKAICIKALNSGSRKSTEESAISGDIFANVEII